MHWQRTSMVNMSYLQCTNYGGEHSRQINADAFNHRAFSHRTVIMFDQMTSLSLSQVFKNIQCELYQIKSVSASRSDVWTKFGPVTKTALKSCHAVFTYCGRKTGTSTMKPPARRGCPRGGGTPYVNHSSLDKGLFFVDYP